MIVLGLDLSLTATGIVSLKDGTIEIAETTKNRPELDVRKRVLLIRDRILKIIKHPNIALDLIVVEGFSYGSKGRSVFDIGYLGNRIKEELDYFKESEGIPWIEVPPTQLKKFATGHGVAKKEIVLQQVYKRWGVEFGDNNQADAYVLAKIGEAYFDESYCTNFQREVTASLRGDKPAKKTRKKVK